nr:DUF2309 domain-containing protein [Alsobacter soli]
MPALAVQPHIQKSSGPDAALRAAVAEACGRIAPLWPLKHFVAVNPFLGFTGQEFGRTCATLKRVARASMLMPRPFYARALATGLVKDDDLAAALQERPVAGLGPAELRAAAFSQPAANDTPPAAVATVAEVLDRCADGDRQVSLVSFMIDEISAFCAAYFDEGQANWPLPVRKLGPYAAWRAVAAYDRNPEIMGVKGFRACVGALPDEPMQAVAVILDSLGVPARAHGDYLYRALFDIGGWAAYARYLGWEAERDGGSDDTLLELLAIRLAWGWALFQSREDRVFRSAWSQAMADAASAPQDHRPELARDLAVDLLLQEAYEIGHRRRLAGAFVGSEAPTPSRRPSVQAAFCIDVRSEVFRRALETALPNVETIGFAGFFGFPIEYVPFGKARGGAQCPVLLKPSFVVCEGVRGADAPEAAKLLQARRLRGRIAAAWKSFKASAVSSFSYVEACGLAFGPKLATDSLGVTRPAPSPHVEGLDPAVAGRLGPMLRAGTVDGRPTGFRPEQKLAMAEAVLKAMSLTGPFARLVLLVGHGGATVNNPHASSLDCGACGGHTGEANARVAAAVMNDPQVRLGLRAKGVDIPDDCWFAPALHDTTTDEVRIFDEQDVPAPLAGDLAQLRDGLARAGALARMERSALLGLDSAEDPQKAIVARSRDWSQVRPEWGLAGNAAFIAAPRSATRGLDLGGRAFLHSYDHAKDQDYRTLELIMTAPMVVASWINLQYFGSTVNNDVFGSGNKTLHNVVGQLGVLEGNAGDLRVGLPLQSVHNGERFVHDPLRLSVFIAAPQRAIDGVLARHDAVRDLVVNRWLFLHRLDDRGRVTGRCFDVGDWRSLA